MNRRLLVDLEALAANYRVFTAASTSRPSELRHLTGPGAVGGVIKANAYGVGAQAALQQLLLEGCRSFFVATLEEALSALDQDRDFLKAGGVFTDDLIDAYIDLKMENVTRLRMATHPVEFDMYYSL